jgi:hypothetical protein
MAPTLNSFGVTGTCKVAHEHNSHGLVYRVYTIFVMSRDSVVGIATTYGLDDRGVGVRVPVRSRIFSSPDRPDRL